MTPSQIKSLRKRLGLSVYDFATALGFSKANARTLVWRWEHGERVPSPQTVMIMKLLEERVK
jgi:DNA-binding transcriptional regulator YiaG